MRDHRLIDQRSLAMHQLIAAKLRDNPTLAENALSNVQRWLSNCAPGVRPALEQWRQLLTGSRKDLFEVMQSASEQAAQLRQSSPFAGALEKSERNALLLAFERSRESRPA